MEINFKIGPIAGKLENYEFLKPKRVKLVEKCFVIYIICREIEVVADLSNVRALLDLHSLMGFCFKWKEFVKLPALCSTSKIPVNA